MDALHHWVISITVAIPLHFVLENLWMVVEVAPSILKDDHQSRKRSILWIQHNCCWWIVSTERWLTLEARYNRRNQKKTVRSCSGICCFPQGLHGWYPYLQWTLLTINDCDGGQKLLVLTRQVWIGSSNISNIMWHRNVCGMKAHSCYMIGEDNREAEKQEQWSALVLMLDLAVGERCLPAPPHNINHVFIFTQLATEHLPH